MTTHSFSIWKGWPLNLFFGGGDTHLLLFLFGRDGNPTIFQFGGRWPPVIFSIWKGLATSLFFLFGKGLPSIFWGGGWPPIYRFIWEGMATYLLFSLEGEFIYLFCIWVSIWEGITKLLICLFRRDGHLSTRYLGGDDIWLSIWRG